MPRAEAGAGQGSRGSGPREPEYLCSMVLYPGHSQTSFEERIFIVLREEMLGSHGSGLVCSFSRD